MPRLPPSASAALASHALHQQAAGLGPASSRGQQLEATATGAVGLDNAWPGSAITAPGSAAASPFSAFGRMSQRRGGADGREAGGDAGSAVPAALLVPAFTRTSLKQVRLG